MLPNLSLINSDIIGEEKQIEIYQHINASEVSADQQIAFKKFFFSFHLFLIFFFFRIFVLIFFSFSFFFASFFNTVISINILYIILSSILLLL
jgi:hypothetical protein